MLRTYDIHYIHWGCLSLSSLACQTSHSLDIVSFPTPLPPAILNRFQMAGGSGVGNSLVNQTQFRLFPDTKSVSVRRGYVVSGKRRNWVWLTRLVGWERDYSGHRIYVLYIFQKRAWYRVSMMAGWHRRKNSVSLKILP